MKKFSLKSFIITGLFGLSNSVIGALFLSYPLLYLFVLVQKTNQIVNLSISTVMTNYWQLLWYLIWPFQQKLQMTNFSTSPGAAEHFYECKLLFQLALTVFIIQLVILGYEKYKKTASVVYLSKAGALIFMILPVAVLPFAMANFDSFFVVFHQLLFNNTNWMFNPMTDPIINILTEGFFAGCFAVAGIIYELYFAQFMLKK